MRMGWTLIFMLAVALLALAGCGPAAAERAYAQAALDALNQGPDLSDLGVAVDLALANPTGLAGDTGKQLLAAADGLDAQVAALRALKPPASMLDADLSLIAAARHCEAVSGLLRAAVQARDPAPLAAVPGRIDQYAAAVERWSAAAADILQ